VWLTWVGIAVGAFSSLLNEVGWWARLRSRPRYTQNSFVTESRVLLVELLPDRLPGMTSPESVLDGWKHDPNEAGLVGGMQIPCHGAQCGFCLFDHGNSQQNTTRAQ